MLRGQLADIISGAIFSFAGLAVCSIAAIRWRRGVRLFVWLGVWSATYGTGLLTRSPAVVAALPHWLQISVPYVNTGDRIPHRGGRISCVPGVKRWANSACTQDLHLCRDGSCRCWHWLVCLRRVCEQVHPLQQSRRGLWPSVAGNGRSREEAV